MNLARKIFGGIYLVGAVSNVIMMVFKPEIYNEFANMALIPFYQTAWNNIVIPNLYVFISLTIGFEAGLSLMFLLRREFLGAAFLISLGFNIGLIPFGLTFLFSNGVLVLVQIYLLWRLRNHHGYGLVGKRSRLTGVEAGN